MSSFFLLHSDVKSTAETLKPTLKSEETTTQFPIDEEATECGEGCVENGGIFWTNMFVTFCTVSWELRTLGKSTAPPIVYCICHWHRYRGFRRQSGRWTLSQCSDLIGLWYNFWSARNTSAHVRLCVFSSICSKNNTRVRSRCYFFMFQAKSGGYQSCQHCLHFTLFLDSGSALNCQVDQNPLHHQLIVGFWGSYFLHFLLPSTAWRNSVPVNQLLAVPYRLSQCFSEDTCFTRAPVLYPDCHYYPFSPNPDQNPKGTPVLDFTKILGADNSYLPRF